VYFKEFLLESKKSSISHFLAFIKKELNLSNLPKIIIVDDPKFSIDNKTFGTFVLMIIVLEYKFLKDINWIFLELLLTK